MALPFAVRRVCTECPFRRDVAPGRFKPARFIALADTARPGGLPSIFACHKSPFGSEMACAGFLLTCGHDSNRVRLAMSSGRLNMADIKSDAPLYSTYREMAVANRVRADHPALDGLPTKRRR